MARRDGRSGRMGAWRYLLACTALIGAYFAVPVEGRDATPVLALRIGLTLVALTVLILAIRRQMLRQLRQPEAPLGGLIVSILAGVLLFALADYTTAYYAPTQFIGLHTRLDALYFALTTLLTIGFGDITAHGQFARGLLCVQMVFNVAVLATAASLLASQIAARARSRRS